MSWSSIDKTQNSTQVYQITKDGNNFSIRDEVAAKAIETLNGDAETSGSVAKAVADAKADLKGTKANGDTTAETIRGAKDYADGLISGLDATQSQSAGTDGLALSVTEVDGVITGISGSIAANTYDAHGAAAAAQTAAEATAASALAAKVGNLGTIAAVGTEGETGYVAAHDATVKEYVDNAVNALAGEDWTANAGTVKQIIDEIKGDDVALSMTTLVDKLDTLKGNVTIGTNSAAEYDVKGYVDAKVADAVLSNNTSSASSIANGVLTLGL